MDQSLFRWINAQFRRHSEIPGGYLDNHAAARPAYPHRRKPKPDFRPLTQQDTFASDIVETPMAHEVQHMVVVFSETVLQHRKGGMQQVIHLDTLQLAQVIVQFLAFILQVQPG